MKKNHKLLLLIPALWASIFDIFITTFFQNPDYWKGDLSKRREGNPIGDWFMSQHVSGLFIISAIWVILIGVLGYYLPAKLRKIFLLFCLMAHSYGASTWLDVFFGFWSVIVFIFLNTVLYSLIEDYVNKKEARRGLLAD
ncbi:hypothetical protein [Marivirga sp.]|uniref:hypothetical protein n=1 Tax=Marivirga sp. TaxID=2018662 RepID=UPI0025E8FF7B|nr:hypothetical protein [Marivirga sp.]